MSEGKLLIKDTRTLKEYELPITHDTVPARAFSAIKGPDTDLTGSKKDGRGLRIYDPGLANTAVIESGLVYIDGKKGQLLFRGYSIGQLWDCDFEELVHLMVWGKLPSPVEKESLRSKLAIAMLRVPEEVTRVIQAFPPSSPPVPMIIAGLSAFIGCNPEDIPAFAGGNIYHKDTEKIDEAVVQTLACWAVVVSITARHREGTLFVPASLHESYYGNLFRMMGLVVKDTGHPDPVKLRCCRHFGAACLDFGLTNSTFSMLVTSSTLGDPISAIISALTAASGPLHFGAQQSAYKAMTKMKSPEDVPKLINSVKQGGRLFGFGHRTWTMADPRIQAIRLILEELGAESNPLLKVAREIDRLASNDEYFKKRGLHANADLYGIFYYLAMGWSADFMTVITFTHRMPGMMAHWSDAMKRDIKILRPSHVYVGPTDQVKGRSSKL